MKQGMSKSQMSGEKHSETAQIRQTVDDKLHRLMFNIRIFFQEDHQNFVTD